MKMPALTLYDAFPSKTAAKALQADLKMMGVQYVRVREGNFGPSLKYGVFVGGKNSRMV